MLPSSGPADAALNLPAESYSHGLGELAAVESAKGSFADAHDAIAHSSGASVAKRQVEDLTRAAAVDFDAYCEIHAGPGADDGEVLVISADGKGIVMRPEALRAATAAAAARSENKLKGRLSKGEKTDRKRMAKGGAVYVVKPVTRAPVMLWPVPTARRPKKPPRRRKSGSPPASPTTRPQSSPGFQ